MKNQVYFWPGRTGKVVLEVFPKNFEEFVDRGQRAQEAANSVIAENGGEVHGEAGMITATCSLCKKSFDFLAGDPNAVPPRLCPECEL